MIVDLTVVSGRESGKTRKITRGGEVTIGRAARNMFQIAEKGVSRNHCVIENKGSRVILRDVGSSNGTFVNDEKVNACLLKSGDRIALGLAVLEVHFRGRGSGAVRRQSSLDLVQDEPTGEFHRRVVQVDKTRLMTVVPDITTDQAVEVVQAHAGLQALFKVGAAINSTESLDSLYETIIDSVLETSGAERAALLIRAPDSGRIEPVAVQSKGDAPSGNIQVSRTVVEGVIDDGVSALSNDALADPRFENGDSISDQNIKAVMCVPVSGKEAVLGALYVDTTLVVRSFGEQDLELLAAIGSQAGLAIERARLVSGLEALFVGANRALVAAVEARDPYTYGHSERVTSMALAIADLMGLDRTACEIVELSGLLHDVGKIGVPEAVLNKPSKLTVPEYERIKWHPVQGAEIVRNIRHPYIDDVVDAVRHHHERWDGSGYPDGLAGEDICSTSRILAVADTYDAMTSDRPYRKGMDRDKALRILGEAAGSQLDGVMVDAFRSAVAEGSIQESDTAESTRKSKYIGTKGIWSLVDTCDIEKVKGQL